MPALPPELRQAYANGNLIVVAGPQLSNEAGLPSLPEITAELIDLAEARNLPLDPAKLRRRLEHSEVAEVLGLLERRFGSEFQRHIERRLADQGLTPPELARRLASMREHLRAVYTVNLDRLLERAFEDAWPSFAVPRADLAQRQKVIFKLRGTLEFAQSWALTREQREQGFGTRSLRAAVFEAAYHAHQLLFFGFVPNSQILALLLDRAVHSGGAEEGPAHYIVLEHAELEEREELERRGLEVIRAQPSEVFEALAAAHGEELESSEAVELAGCPYPGLQAFGKDDATIFFGRQAEISAAASRVGGLGPDHRRWLAIEGPSGVGKSSFAHAGVVPALERGFGVGTPARWKVISLRPGPTPMSSLVWALHGALELGGSAEQSMKSVRGVPAQASGDVLADLIHGGVRGHALLILVDQLEELVTLAESEERLRFCATLAELLTRGLIYLVTTLRTDFVPALQVAAPELAGLLNEEAERYALPPISRVGLREAILGPARLAGIRVEAGMVERLVHDAEAMGGSSEGSDRMGQALTQAATLPLVAHVLRGLWDAGAHDDGLIELREYEALGGVSGALSRSADALLTKLDRRARDRAKELFLAMVRVSPIEGETRRTLTRDAAVAIAGEDVLQELSGGRHDREGLSARLLVVHADGGQVWVDLVHEALLRGWGTLARWIEEDRGQLVLDGELERQAARWDRHRRPRWNMPRGQELAGLLQGRPRGAGEAVQREYQGALRWAARVRRGSALGVAVVVAAISAGVAFVLDRNNEQLEATNTELDETNQALDASNQALDETNRELTDNLSAQLGLRAQTAITDGRDVEALALGIQAVAGYDPSWVKAPPPEAVTGLEQALGFGSIVVRDSVQLSGHDLELRAIEFSPSGATFTTGSKDGTAKIWRTEDGVLLATLEGHKAGYVTALCYPDEGRVVTASMDGTARIWTTTGATLEVLSDHGGPVADVACANDGQRIVTVSKDQTARVWDAEGKLIHVLEGHRDKVYAVALSPDDRSIVTGSADGSARVWAMDTGELIHDLRGHSSWVYDVDVSSNGKYVATAGFDNDARLWRLDDGELIATLEGHSKWVYALAFSPDGRQLATISNDDTARLWTSATGELEATLRGHEGALRGLAYAPDGSQLATASMDHTTRLWDPTAGIHIATLEGHERTVYALDYSPDGEYLATASYDRNARLWDPRVTRKIASTPGHTAAIYRLAWSPDGTRLATASLDHTARIWDPKTGEPVHLLAEHDDEITRLAFSPDGRLLVTSSQDLSLGVWDVLTGTLVRRLEGHTLRPVGVAFSPDGKQVASAGQDKTVRVWSLETDDPPRVLEDHTNKVESVAYSPDGRLLLSASLDNSARVWDLGTGKALHELSGHTDAVLTIAPAPGRQLQIATSSRDGTVRIWEPTEGQAKVKAARVLSGHTKTVYQLVYSPDGKRVASASEDGSVKIWDPNGGGKALQTFADHRGAVYAVVYSPDGKRIASASEDGTGRLWNATTGGLIAELDGHFDEVGDVGFSPDGKLLATASDDGTVRIWDARTGEFALSLESQIGRIEADGTISWPVPPQELGEIGCERLAPFASEYPEAAALCTSLQGGQ